MKRWIALMLCIMTVCFATCAFAETAISWRGSDTVEFHTWSTPGTSSGTSWHIEWDTAVTNIVSNRRAVVRIMSDGKYASSLWVYSKCSTAYHKYNTGYGQGKTKTYVTGRLDDRDGAQAPLIVKGSFFN